MPFLSFHATQGMLLPCLMRHGMSPACLPCLFLQIPCRCLEDKLFSFSSFSAGIRQNRQMHNSVRLELPPACGNVTGMPCSHAQACPCLFSSFMRVVSGYDESHRHSCLVNESLLNAGARGAQPSSSSSWNPVSGFPGSCGRCQVRREGAAGSCRKVVA